MSVPSAIPDLATQVAKLDTQVDLLNKLIAYVAIIAAVFTIITAGLGLWRYICIKDLNKAKSELGAQEKAKSAEEIAAIKKKQAPRSLTEDQKSRMINTLRVCPKGPIQIWLSSKDDETAKFSDQILLVLTTAGWQIDDDNMFSMSVNGNNTDSKSIGRIFVYGLRCQNHPDARRVATA